MTNDIFPFTDCTQTINFQFTTGVFQQKRNGFASMPEREILNVDVLIVGAGPAGLSCAIRLYDEMAQRGRLGSPVAVAKPNILVIEKGVSTGAHSLSGAVFDPRALDELMPDWRM